MNVWRAGWWCGFAALGLVVTGCANLTDITSDLDRQRPCCQTLRDLPSSAVVADAPTPIRLGAQSPVFEFDVGKSYFAALELPADSAGRMLQLYSMATGSTAFETRTLAQIFCPRVLFLDADRQAIGASEQKPVYDVFKGFGALRRGAGSQARIPSGARFAVVHSNPARYGQFISRHDGPSGYVVGNTYVRSAGDTFSFPCAPVADALVRIE